MKLRVGLLMALVVALGCDSVSGESGRGEAVPVVAPPRVSPVELLPPTVDRSVTQRVEVRDPPAIPAVQVDVQRQSDGIVDILWVVDDSGSMANQRQTLTDNFARFLEELLALQVRFQIGVISTNFNDRGVLRGTTKIITNATPNPRGVFIQNTTFPTGSRARLELGLRMMELALSEPNRGGPNAGFLRPNAALAVIVVTDEDDNSYGEPTYYTRFLRSLKGPGNENLSSLSIIGGTTPDGCFPPGEENYFGGRADPAFRYSAVATRTGGIIGSICDISFENTLVKIAAALNTLRRVFPLSLKPDPATLTVRVNGTLVPRDVVNGWQYREETQSVTFLGNYVPPPGAVLRFEYAIALP
ncbi:vWA domain-containing protein [Hyalangium rubrum]|uniref:VWA domain-containing protein n=1 Tax=Hyalangium rubrum TaxID=3103134 RepID=A0ABU5HDC3_9BACT|nr:vWA domain-containing protein [Hyalangium sp. s54d21]MDY7230879.1 vWA domain-containing protein [Hyalangium sp. s54d21]